ncbi:hypothetical protein BKA64DRAFT_767589 [Cadophora sp. MPI-SDFR-AT-0126]|nr:hypothetical protein BKA64DRAFT_767589 [Leotiomycetes sp. MPI-SDFR-AT-0126]
MAPQTPQFSGYREPIAVVGTGVRFSGSSNNPSTLWDLLLEPRDLLSQIPEERFNANAFYHPHADHHGSTNVRGSYFLDQDVRHFDSNFFNIKPKEAHAIDPQQRILLEVVYEALEAAGLSIRSLAGSQTGIYVGLMCSDYANQQHRDIDSMPVYTGTGISRGIMSNRVSYFFDWHGPSMTIDTACSSSLVAVHQAVQLLRSGDSDVAVAAGANLLLDPLQFVEFSKLHMLSPESRCNMWDQDASGYARGEGVAAIVLKRLSTAIADGDHIECIIRESGINQDGRTKGITMPSSTAQAQLIARTYARAGLDPRNPEDRCQYFEAHGTGTQAGDPREAEAISTSFFLPGEVVDDQGREPLYVGSIKTVLGHTEGTAGLAGLVKTSLALQHGIIPPNYGFKRLSPAVEPFYTNLKILDVAQDWPSLPEGTPRRASVNSFGFGGTNAHVILESIVTSTKSHQQQDTESYRQLTPLNFSAASKASLKTLLANYLSYLQSHPGIILRDLSHTLHTRRSDHASRISISASSMPDLVTKIDSIITEDDKSIGTQATSLPGPPRILGIFTGQGAQWARMGKELVMNIPQMHETIRDMDAVLQSLPAQERPSWSLHEELLRDAETSRISTAIIGQPLCTMVQLLLCDLLSTAGIKFESVVGHSGGEVAAAYAAGMVCREDALKIAYFRGLITDLNPSNSPGGMMAIGTSVDEAYKLCERLGGRVVVAAINSPSSITIAGDLDAINKGKAELDADKKFARVLKVDKAYHSHHMVPAGHKYVEALKGTKIKVRRPYNDCPVWYSSVFENRVMGVDDDLAAQYWADNMIRPVLFSHALARATEDTNVDLAIEVGPHPTLKGPALQTLSPELPYTGVLWRNKDDVEAFSDSLAYIWSSFSPSIVDFAGYDSLALGSETRKLVTGLPTYPWDHQTPFWHTSRASEAFLHPKSPPNPLLGSWCTGVAHGEMRWRNSLRLNDLSWIRDHKLQGQIVFPAAAYLSTAIEAAQHLIPKGEHISMIEVEDFAITRPLVIKESDNGIETIFTLRDIVRDKDGSYIAFFHHDACSSSDTNTPLNHANGRIVVTVGKSSSYLLPKMTACQPNSISVPKEQFYTSLSPMGYKYAGSFRSVSSIMRKLDFASTTVTVPAQNECPDSVLLHPGLLESALQGMLLAYSHPGDGSLQEMYVLNRLRRFRVNVPLCNRDLLPNSDLLTCTQLTAESSPGKQLSGDTDIYSIDGTGLIQFECIQLVPLAGPTPDNDRRLFAERRWDLAFPSAQLAMGEAQATAEDHDLANAVERICLHYMQQTLAQFPASIQQHLNLPWHFSYLFNFFSHIVDTTRNGTRLCVDPKWLADTDEDIAGLKRRYADFVDVGLACAVGNNLSSVLRGQTTMLEHMTKNNLLDQFYAEGLAMREYSTYLARTVKQLVHRYANMNILEIGAGTGGATKLIMKHVNRSFSSYTYTDISPGFFENAQQVFSSSADKMIFKTLNVECDILSQGFEEHSYDLVVASLVLHATVDLNRTISNVRRLLKPGGYLIMTEVSNNNVSRIGFMMCAMPGWWLGHNEGRALSPCIPASQWHDLLLRNGFNGIDSATPDLPGMAFPLAVLVSRAIDDRMELLIQSTSRQSLQAVVDGGCEVVLVGGQTPMTASLIDEIVQMLGEAGIRFTVFKSVADVNGTKRIGKSIALNLEEFDRPVSYTLPVQSHCGLKELYSTQDAILHVVGPIKIFEEPRTSTNPSYPRVFTSSENVDCAIQLLEVDTGIKPTAQHLLQVLISLYHSNELAKSDSGFDMLYTKEPELAFKDGQIFVSRIYHNNEANERLNATRRTIYQPVNPQNTAVELVIAPDSTYDLAVSNVIPAAMTTAESLAASKDACINVSHSIANFVSNKTSSPSYLIIGTDATTNITTVATSSSNSSKVVARKDKTVVVPELPEKDRPQFLAQLYIQLQVECILTGCTAGSSLLLHEPCRELATGIIEGASRRNITPFFTTCSPVPKGDGFWIKLTQYSSKRQILSSLPVEVSVFIDCSTFPPTKRIGSLIGSCFPDNLIKSSLMEICATENILLSSAVSFSGVCHKALEQLTCSSGIRLTVGEVNELVGTSSVNYEIPTIIDWKSCSEVPIPVLPIESQVAFKANQTYALFQFSSRLSQSLCEWMFKHGARNIVVSSQDHIDEMWLHYVRSFGLKIKVFEDMVSDKHALLSLVNGLQKDSLPIAGVGYGGMFMQNHMAFDETSAEMPYHHFKRTVQEAQNLGEIFQCSSADLDFFVLFSSLMAVTGEPSRFISHEGGSFMSALARQRRERGLSAAVLHIGDVVGLHTGTHHCPVQLTQVEKATAQTVSERAFHTCVAEAIATSHPLCQRNHEVIAGLPPIVQDDDVAPWSKDPRFQHVLRTEESSKPPMETLPEAVSVKMQILSAQTSEDVFEIVAGAFFIKLKACLQLPPDHDRSRTLSSGTDELGIDSLVAVEIRSWFLREIEADVAVFKILAGDTIAKLVGDVVQDLPSYMAPCAYEKLSESKLETEEKNVVAGRHSWSTSDRNVTISGSNSMGSSDQSDEQGDATDTTVSEESFEKH